MAIPQWMEDASSVSITPAILSSLRLRRGASKSWGPCPGCGEEKRSTSDRTDKKLAIGIRGDGQGWRCWRGACDAKGDLIDLIAYQECGSRWRDLTSNAQRDQVREACVSMGFCAAPEPRTPGRRQRVPARGGRQGRKWSIGKTGSINTRTGHLNPAPAEVLTTPGDAAAPGAPFAWSPTLYRECYQRLRGEQGAVAWRYLTEDRGFSAAVLRRWGIGLYIVASRTKGAPLEHWITIPLRDPAGEVVNIRFRIVPGTRVGKGPKYRVIAGRPLPLFGGHNLSDPSSGVIITEGELDVLAFDDLGWGSNVVSTTAGTDAEWPGSWLDLLEEYPVCFLAGDNDPAGEWGGTIAKKLRDGHIQPGEEIPEGSRPRCGMQGLAERLGRHRCMRVIMPRKDAAECLEAAVPQEEIVRSLQTAEPMSGIRLRSVGDYEQQIEDLIANPDLLIGRSLGSAKLDLALGGMRPGLWVITGGTGEGKTTFATWLSLMQARQDEPVLITSFEQKPIGSVQKFLRMECGGDFTKKTRAERGEAFRRLDNMPLYLLDHYGEITPDEMQEILSYGRRRLNIRTALIDHLGFLTRHRGNRDERMIAEDVIRDLAIYSINEGMTILLIVHPNRQHVHQQRRVQLTDAKGASAIEQDAHVGIVVEACPPSPLNGLPHPMSKIYVDKVRSEFGNKGSCAVLAMDPLSCVYADEWRQTPSGAAGLIAAPGGKPAGPLRR